MGDMIALLDHISIGQINKDSMRRAAPHLIENSCFKLKYDSFPGRLDNPTFEEVPGYDSLELIQLNNLKIRLSCHILKSFMKSEGLPSVSVQGDTYQGRIWSVNQSLQASRLWRHTAERGVGADTGWYPPNNNNYYSADSWHWRDYDSSPNDTGISK